MKVLLLHGLGGNSISLYPLKKYLEWKNLYVEVLHYCIYTLNLEESVEHIKNKLIELVSPEEPIIIIGQSMGGVIGHKLEKEFNIKLLITIGSPLKGARILHYCDYYIPEFIKKILHKPMFYDLIEMTQQNIEEPQINYHCITMGLPFSDFDGCVYKDEAHFHPDYHTHLRFTTHHGVFAEPRLWITVFQIIEKIF